MVIPRSYFTTRAFTLIEIVGTLVLLGVLAAVAVNSLSRPSARLAAETDMLASHLRYAQSRALADIEPWRLEFVTPASYQVRRIDGTPVLLPGESEGLRSLRHPVTLVSPPTEIRFDPWGRPIAGNGAPLQTDLTLTLTDGTQSRSITLFANTGFVR